MKVEHLTLMGNSLVRDTAIILPQTLEMIQVVSGEETGLPATDLKIRTTLAPEGALFDLLKRDDIGFTNFCCFGPQHRKEILDLVRRLAEHLGMEKHLREPKEDCFLYTVPVIPFLFSLEELQSCGEVELYIYYKIYLEHFK